MKIVMTSSDFSDEYLEICRQIGLDGLDTNRDHLIPGLKECGEADSAALKALARRLEAAGLPLFCMNLPHPLKFMSGIEGGEAELAALGRSLLAFADAGIPVARVRVEPPVILRTHEVRQRGSYNYKAFNLDRWRSDGKPIPWLLGLSEQVFWERGLHLYESLMPLAEKSGIKLAMHPSDPPIAGAPFDAVGWDRLIEALPGPLNGLLYCVGTRAEAAGQAGVLAEIARYGTAGRIFHVHLRNVRGNLRDSGGFDEVLLDDGDLDLLEVLRALKSAGYNGALNPDHIPTLGKPGRAESNSFESLCFAVGYLKGLLASLEGGGPVRTGGLK